MLSFARTINWVRWKLGIRPPWVSLPPFDPWGSPSHGEHKIEAVSRHAIAETGLMCPACHNEICPRGDYTVVREGQVGGYCNEVVICKGQRDANGTMLTCGAVLAASPDTEHGDNLLWDKVPKEKREALFFRFRRISEEQMLKEKYGFDVVMKEGQLSTTGKQERPAFDKMPLLEYQVGDVYTLSNNRLGHITEILKDHPGDSHFAGWCIMEIDGDGVRWFVNPHGIIRRDMTDPTMNNITLLAKQDKV